MMLCPVAFGNFTLDFIDELARKIAGRRVLEVFAGNGLLASMLALQDVKIISTSCFSGHDGHQKGLFYDVEELDVAQAIRSHGEQADVLLMSWPTTSDAAARAVLLWGSDRDIVFIGEMPRPELGMCGLAGCASDLFFELTRVIDSFASYEPRNMLDRAVVLRLDEIGEELLLSNSTSLH